MRPTAGPGEEVIGVALAVPEPYAGQLEAARTSFGDPLGATVPAHVTLVPPTPVRVDGLGVVRAHLARAAQAAQPFQLRLEGTGTFRPVSPVVYVRVADGATECAALERRVRAGVLAGQRRFPYHPHVTVAHDLDDAALDRAGEQLAGYRAAFSVGALHLYRHGPDGVWRGAAAFALGG